MPVSDTFDEPTIPPQLRRPLAAVWISLGLHAAVIALVQVAPPAATSRGEQVIEARLVSKHASAATETLPAASAVATPADTPKDVPLLAPGETAEALPVVVPPPVQAAPPAATFQPVEPEVGASRPASAAAPSSAQTPATAVTSSVDLNYYSAREVDVQAKPTRDFDLKYPEVADRLRLSGKVRLNLKIEADGRVSDIDLVSTTHPDLYDESKLKVILDMPFSPAIRNGRPVRELFQIEVEYDWEGQPR